MTVGRPLVGQRYALDPPAAEAGIAQRAPATDEKLGREVVVWLVEGREGAPGRETLLDLARTVARLAHPSLWQVLDIVPERDRLAVVLEAPPPEVTPLGAAPGRGLPALVAAAAALEVVPVLEAGIEAGLEPARLPEHAVYAGADGAIRLDPVAVFAPGVGRARPLAPSALLADWLTALLDGDAEDPATAGFDPGARRLRGLVEPWRPGGRARVTLEEAAEALRAFLAAPEGPPPAPVALDDDTTLGEDWDDEPTLRLAPLPAPAEPTGPLETGARRRGRGTRRKGTSRTTDPRTAPRRGFAVPWRIAVPGAAALLVAVLAVVGVLTAGDPEGSPGGNQPDGVPVEQPVAGQVTVGLLAQEDSALRVTVDGVVEFDGVLRAGERQSWEGSERIQVWTDKGRTMLLSVNGQDLGAYSPAMGHPDWNRIDYGFWPGWAP